MKVIRQRTKQSLGGQPARYAGRPLEFNPQRSHFVPHFTVGLQSRSYYSLASKEKLLDKIVMSWSWPIFKGAR